MVRALRMLTATVLVLGVVSVPPTVATAADTPDPSTVTIAGSLQSEAGCAGDWDPGCASTHLAFDANDGVWQQSFDLPAGSFEYKAALNGSWDENYGKNATKNGDNIPLSLAAAKAVKFYYDHESHWVTDNVTSTIAVAAGSFQSELGCSGDWDPSCLRSWLQDPDGDGTYQLSTTALPPGSYEFKAALNESWDVNYGANGEPNGANIPFTVTAEGDRVTISYTAADHTPSVTVTGQGEVLPGDEDIARASVRQSTVGEKFYFVMPDRFANGDTGNDTAGVAASEGRLVHGLDATDKGFYHGGDLAGLDEKLDYLDDMGITAIWMTPMFKNRWVQGEGANASAGYHGYWTTDFTQIDPHFGTTQEMSDLIADAHDRGIKVFFDIITNHTADVIQYAEDKYTYRSKAAYPYVDADGNEFDDAAVAGSPDFPTLDAGSFPYTPEVPAELADVKKPAWLNDVTMYHNRGDSTFAGESSQYGDFSGLDDLFTENPAVVDGMIDIFSTWISELGIDGYRIDTAKHVNDQFWQAFAPAIQQYAAAHGKPDFFFFGEVFDGNPSFTSRYSTELKLPAVLDFPFQGAASGYATGSSATVLRDLFAQDDLYTDADSNAYSLPTFLGNHDMGRIGYFLRNSDDKLQRDELAHSLMYLSRGNPVVYYGDEQGFTGDGGDKDARQDMFPSQVASYNDDDLIGTDETTADDNFDTSHPLYQHIESLAALTEANPALRTGLQQHRYAASGAGIYAFSRMDWAEGVEYVVAVNNATSAQSATIPTYSANLEFAGLWPSGTAGATTNASRGLNVTVPALSAVVYKATAPIAESAAPGISVVLPPEGTEVVGDITLKADVAGAAPEQVTFAVRTPDQDWTIVGTDDNAPYSVSYDVSKIAKGTDLEIRAVVSSFGGKLNGDSAHVTVGEEVEPPPVTGSGADYLVVHYNRPDGNYDDWGLHAWGDIEGTVDWGDPIAFTGEDSFGRFAWVKLASGGSNVGIIVHNGDDKEPGGDRFVNPQVTPQVWLNSGDEEVYSSLAAARGFARIHYDRTADDYDGWGLHLWGDGLADGAGTEWASPRMPDGTDDYGVYWDVPLKDATAPLNFIIHKGDEKDVAPDQSFVPAVSGEIWRNQGVETIFVTRGAAQGYAEIHYNRPDGDYGDYTSSDFNDFWGLHVWDGAASPNPSWTEPLKPIRVDAFGPVFRVPLVADATRLNFIIHRGDTKDPNGDQALDLEVIGNEAWYVSGQQKDNQIRWLLPVVARGVDADLSKAQAHWVSQDTVLWKADGPETLSYSLRWSTDGGITAGAAGVSGGKTIRLSYDPDGMTDALKAQWPHLAGYQVFTVRSGDLDVVPEALRGQVVAVEKAADGTLRRATSVQIPGVLDDLYAAAAKKVVLGPSVKDSTAKLRLWAPTAQSARVLVFDTAASQQPSQTVDMTRDDTSGVWSAAGRWKGKYYLYEVKVWAPSTQEVVTNQVTDPYSLSLSMNSARSQVVDLTDRALKPSGWDSLAKPKLKAPEDISVYELHVRDFSANDPTVPAADRGTFEAFTLKSSGTDHLKALAKAGLSHVHLLPAFDFATVDENRATWQQPDEAALAGLPPDSDQQQAAVSATAATDGFNWGYDPWHYTVPEGSYSTDPQGTRRIVEFRDMVKALNKDGLRVVMDVVYNHTTASGQAPKSVLDRVVPGYYQRLDDVGAVATSTCCSNTASEHAMMEKLMIDSLVTWAKQYKVDGFRFDLMGHHSKQNMLNIRAALDRLTLAKDGVDGKSIYLYGEGWNFGEVADNARFVQATQANMAGTGIGTFNDRLRDAVRGGGPFDGGDDLIKNQGLVSGLWYDPNELVKASGPSEQAQRDELLLSADQTRVGLAGNLADFEFVDRTGALVKGSQVDYNGSPTGYTADPQENIVYVEAHDNQTLYDISQYKHPLTTSMADRVRAQNLGMDYTVLSQGVPFVHAGMEMLRSKSMDSDSYDSGDWFNKLDFTMKSNNWGVGLPVAGKNQANWSIIGPRLANPALKPASPDIEAASDHLAEMLAIREASPLFRLQTAKQVSQRLTFANTGPDQVPGLIVMSLADPAKHPLAGGDLDRKADSLVVLFNATDTPVKYALKGAKTAKYSLHPIQQKSADKVVRGAGFDARTGSFTVPARTTAVFVQAAADTKPPVAKAALVPLKVSQKQGTFLVKVSCTDDRTAHCASTADINGIKVKDGQRVTLVVRDGSTQASWDSYTGALTIKAPKFLLTLVCKDAAGNTSKATARPEFAPGKPYSG